MNTDGSNNHKFHFHPFRAIINAFKYAKAEKHRNFREQDHMLTHQEHAERIRTANLRALNTALGQENRLIIEGQKAHTANMSQRVKDATNVRDNETKRGIKTPPKKMRFPHDEWQDSIKEQLQRNRTVHDKYFGTGEQQAHAQAPQPNTPPPKQHKVWNWLKGIFGRKNKTNGNPNTNEPPNDNNPNNNPPNK